MLEDIISNINTVNYIGFKDYPIPLKEDSEEPPSLELVAMVSTNSSDYETYELPSEEATVPDYLSLTESIRASSKPFYTNYLQDVANKEIVYVNMPEVRAYGWVDPNDPTSPIFINTAYAYADEQKTKTIAHERNHVQTKTHHEYDLQHELRVRVDTNTSYFS